MEKYELFEGHYANKEQAAAIDSLQEFLEGTDVEYTLIGRGGTGKTTLLKKVLEPYLGKNVAIAAPSHAAKKVLEQSFSSSKKKPSAFTVASLLGMKLNVYKNKFEIDEISRRKNGIPIERFNIVIIDEASMIDEDVKSNIVKYKPGNCKIVYVGDSAQLPPIREENTLFADKDSPVFDVRLQSKLKERMRQGEDSPIVPITDIFAKNIDNTKEGKKIVSNPLLFEYRKSNYNRDLDEGVIFTSNAARALSSLVADLKKEEALNNPMYAKAIVYTNAFRQRVNDHVRKKLWGDNLPQYVIGENVVSFSTFVDENNSPIIHNSDTFTVTHIGNGKVGSYKCLWLTLVNKYTSAKVPVVAEESLEYFESTLNKLKEQKKWKAYYSLREKFAHIEYGYAITSHKAQGSTYRNSYVFEDDIFNTYASDKTKNQSMYVAVSRPSHKLLIVSNKNPKD